MGSPISVVVAEIVMQTFEKNLIDRNQNTWKTWLRYVDDIFTIVKKNDLNDLFSNINSVN